MIRRISRAVLVPICLLLFCVIPPVTAVSEQMPPMVEFTMPFTESEAGGIGCIVASTAVGSVVTYLMGGIGPIIAFLAGPMHPIQVLEVSAAAAFVFSSSCYMGVVLAPLGMLTYTSLVDSFASSPEPSSLFAPVPSNLAP